MANVTYFANAPAGHQLWTIFNPVHSPSLPNTLPTGTTNSDGVTVQYQGFETTPGVYFVNQIIASNGSGTFLIIQVAAFTTAFGLDAFHSGGLVSAQTILAGPDVINGGDNADLLIGFDGADTLNGGKGADILLGDLGNDTMNGGAGNDTYVVVGGDIVNEAAGGGFDIVDVGSNYIQGDGQEVELLRVVQPVASFTIDITGNNLSNVIVGGAGANSLNGREGNDYLFSRDFNADGTIKAGAGNDILNGGDGADGLFAGDGNDDLSGGDGVDGLVGGAGNDELQGGADGDFLFGGAFSPSGQRLANSGEDTLFGNEGNDGLYGFDGGDVLSGGAGDDYVEGGDGGDNIGGGADSDFLLGQEGADTINGGTGFDYLYGGTGGDTFSFLKGDSADWVLDFKAIEGDKIRFSGFDFASVAAIPFVDLSTPGNPAVQVTVFNSTTGAFDQLTVFGVALAQLNATNVLVA